METAFSTITNLMSWIMAQLSPACRRVAEKVLGFTNCYRQFIRSFSTVAAPLTSLLEGKPKWICFKLEAMQAFQIKFTQLYETIFLQRLMCWRQWCCLRYMVNLVGYILVPSFLGSKWVTACGKRAVIGVASLALECIQQTQSIRASWHLPGILASQLSYRW